MLIPLNSGAYEARDLIADAQKAVNVFPEANPQNNSPPVPVTHYPTPGCKYLSSPPTAGVGRALYVDIDRQLYAVVGPYVYTIDETDWSWTQIGVIAGDTTATSLLTTPVSITDNETTCFLTDGRVTGGYTWDVGTGANFTHITDDNFLGSNRVDYLNTFFLFAEPSSPKFYTSNSASTDINPLYFANMTGSSTDITAAVMLHGVIWLIGRDASEIWFTSPNDTGDFPFQRMPDQVLHQGCEAPYSIVRVLGDDDAQNAICWLGHTKDGGHVVLLTQGYATKRISTHAIENDIQNYPQIDDAIGWAYQQEGHTFYALTFPSADITWVFDLTIGLWHKRSWLDANGTHHRHRANCVVSTGTNHIVALDWEDGTLYELDLDTYVDQVPAYDPTSVTPVDGPISRIRSFPHLVNGLNRTIYARFIADMDVGNVDSEERPQLSLRWSDDRGHSYGNPIMYSLGNTGQYNKSIMWTRLGIARDRVFELSWSGNFQTALNGAYVEPIPLAT